jgi:hypothetical protein
MRKRWGYPVIVEIRCGKANGSCGRLSTAAMLKTERGPMLAEVAERAGRVLRRTAPDQRSTVFSKGRPFGSYLDAPIDGRMLLGFRLLGDFSGSDDSGDAFTVSCPDPEHGSGSVTRVELAEAIATFRRTGRAAVVVFVPPTTDC